MAFDVFSFLRLAPLVPYGLKKQIKTTKSNSAEKRTPQLSIVNCTLYIAVADRVKALSLSHAESHIINEFRHIASRFFHPCLEPMLYQPNAAIYEKYEV